jgi:hypothetical protein
MKTFVFILFSAVALVGCQEEIQLDLPANEPELVIEGYLVDFDFYIPENDLDCFGQFTITRDQIILAAYAAAAFPIDSVEKEADYFPFKKVKLTTTTDYFSNGDPATVSDAVVRLYQNGNLVETLVENSEKPGTYPITHDPQVGSSYYLEVEALGKFYRTDPEVYENVPPLFGISANYTPTFLQDSCAFYMGIQTFEKPNTKDHYRWLFYTNNSYNRSPFSLSISNDDNFDGFCLFDIDVYNSELELGDTLVVFQMHTSESYYKYITALRQQTGFVGSPFDSPPAPVHGNLLNVTNGTRAHGFFAAGGISANAVVVPDTIPAGGCGI